MKELTKLNSRVIIKLVIIMGYYNYDEIDALNATYSMIIGQRSNGKTFGWCRKALAEYLATGIASAYIRRLDEQIKPKYIESLFNPHLEWIERESKGKWNRILYRSNAFYLSRYEILENGVVKQMARDIKPFCRTYAINTMETSKGSDDGEVKYICFDEFITRKYYLQNEFVMFQNLLSSIIRERSGVKIYMLANTVNKYCPYFKDMGLTKIENQKQGTIDVYRMGKTKTTVAVEYCSTAENVSTKVAKYFAFDNPQLKMITKGGWEIALYRHAPPRLSDYPIIQKFFVIFDGKTVQGNIYMYQSFPLVFFHPKTTEIKSPENEIIYLQDSVDGNPLHQVDIRCMPTRAHKIIMDLFKQQKVFYSDNETGEIISNWLKYVTSVKVKGHI